VPGRCSSNASRSTPSSRSACSSTPWCCCAAVTWGARPLERYLEVRPRTQRRGRPRDNQVPLIVPPLPLLTPSRRALARRRG
jgi:hypothetical protein